VPAHLRPPERRPARTVGVLAVAVGVALLVLAGFTGRPADERTTQLVQPATQASSEPTVLGSETERTTIPDAPPASAAELTTTTTEESGGGGTSVVTSPQLSPSPTLGPPVSVTRPPPPRPTTTTTAPTTTEAPTTTAEHTTTTTEP
jgi:hypothetical protein